jgi:succinate dehydrogenase / fumarate reductase iron-sulfur subunit
MKLVLEIWRQPDTVTPGAFATYAVADAAPGMSLLEQLDRLNESLVEAGTDPVVFDSDCREGVCGSCGITVDGRPHGPEANTPSCRQHLRSFADGARITLEPLRSGAFPVVRDLVVDRSALDRVIEAGGFISVAAGTAPDADSRPVPHATAEAALEFGGCIGCGACVAACPNGAAHLFVGSKLAHLALSIQGGTERGTRALSMTDSMDAEFGPCSTFGECATVCPADIPLTAIAAVPKETLRARLRGRPD